MSEIQLIEENSMLNNYVRSFQLAFLVDNFFNFKISYVTKLRKMNLIVHD